MVRGCTKAASISAEYSWNLHFNDFASVEPQVELTYGTVMGDDLTASNDVKIEQYDVDSFIGRIGVRGGFLSSRTTRERFMLARPRCTTLMATRTLKRVKLPHRSGQNETVQFGQNPIFGAFRAWGNRTIKRCNSETLMQFCDSGPNMPSLSFLLKQLKAIPKLSAMVDVMRADKETGENTNWANWCFLPHEVWNSIAQSVEANPIRQSTLGDFLSAVGTWRYSQGIYRFDKTFYQAVACSEGMSKIPSEVLLRLPEWCVFVETPNMTFLGASIDGFFAHLDDDRTNGRTILRLSLVEHETPDPLSFVTFPIHLGEWSVEEAYNAFAHETVQGLARSPASIMAASQMSTILSCAKLESVQLIEKMLSLLLYLCTEKPDVIDRREPEWKPGFPKPKKVKGGLLRYFPAEKERIYDVGLNLGQQLRAAEDQLPSAPTGRHVRSHLRRGHWHGYWSGPRKSGKPGQRKFELKWLFPIFVHGSADKQEDEEKSRAPDSEPAP